MAIYHCLEEYRPAQARSSVALGFFDGVHRGHKAVLASCAEGKGDGRCVVLTFSESPAKALGRECPPLLTDNAGKAALMSAEGAEDIIFADFASIKDMSAGDFVRLILHEKLNAGRVYCGFNYRFGKNGSGDVAELKELCGRYGTEVCVIEPIYVGGEQVSSTRIRELILGGEIERANEMLGHCFGFSGDVGSGNRIGSTMGFPTVNIPIGDGIAVPRFGVYASRIIIDGALYRGATNIGVHPTVRQEEKPLCETFILEYSGDSLYGKRAVCELTAFIREERRFDSVGELSEQIRLDCERIRAMYPIFFD